MIIPSSCTETGAAYSHDTNTAAEALVRTAPLVSSWIQRLLAAHSRRDFNAVRDGSGVT